MLVSQPACWINDTHTRLNPTRVREVLTPQSLADLQAAVHLANCENLTISLSGGRHAMGGQQFAPDALHLSTIALNRILSFDREAGLVEVEAGIQWSELIHSLVTLQEEEPHPWAIIQKPTGADSISIGGCLSANVHGRGLTLKPFIQDVENFTLVLADGQTVLCSRQENPDLFRRVIGGYGMFGLIYTVTLRLTKRTLLMRRVQMLEVPDLMEAFDTAIAAGALYGDFQFSIDNHSPDFLYQGIFSVYRRVSDETPIPTQQKALSLAEWGELVILAHSDKARAFEKYAAHYLATDCQIYASDTHQLSTYLDNYHATVDEKLGCEHRGSEIITELYVPRTALPEFMAAAATLFRQRNTSVIYGTIRLIEEDDESALPWAKGRYACIIFNLHTEHAISALERSADTFRALIDLALRFEGNYYLTYHRFATQEQLLACYPNFPEFLEAKKYYDPSQRFQSRWYQHCQKLLESV